MLRVSSDASRAALVEFVCHSSCACWLKSACTVWHLNISHDAMSHWLLQSLDYHSFVPGRSRHLLLARTKNVYSNAASLLLLWPSVLELSANWTSTPDLTLGASGSWNSCYCQCRTLDLVTMRAYVSSSLTVHVDCWAWNVCLLTDWLTEQCKKMKIKLN